MHVKGTTERKFSLFALSLSLSFVVLLFLSFWLKHLIFLNQQKFIIKKSERESFKEMFSSSSSSAFGGGGTNNEEKNKVHSKPVTFKTRERRRRKKRLLVFVFSFTFLIVVMYISYNFLRKQTLSEARRIIGTGRKARTDLEGQVLVEEAIKTGKIGREVINFDDGSLDRMIEENIRKKKQKQMEEEERKMMFHEESHQHREDEKNDIYNDETKEEDLENEGVDNNSDDNNNNNDSSGEEEEENAVHSSTSSDVDVENIINEDEDIANENEKDNAEEEQEEARDEDDDNNNNNNEQEQEDTINDEPLEEVKPGAGDADDLDPKLPRSESLPEDPSRTCSVDRLRALFKPCLLGGDVQKCCQTLDFAFAPDATHRFEDQDESESGEDTTANCLCVFTAISDLNETFSKVGLNVYEDVLGKCEPDSRKFGWFGDGTDACPEDNLEELRRRKDEEIREHEEARKERERKKKEVYKRNVERAKKQEAIRVENALKKSDTERQARELRRREREENLRKEARLVTWRLKEAKAAEKALREAEAKQAKFFGTGGGIQDVGCYEEGEKPMKGQKPC